MAWREDFGGAKVALFLGDALAVIQRDDIPGLPWAGYWDLPGGGREARETPFECLAREVTEELGLALPTTAITLQRRFETSEAINWFFVAHLPATAADRVAFGDEGQGWTLMTPAAYCAHPKAIPRFQDRLRLTL